MGIIKIILILVLIAGSAYAGFVYGQMFVDKNSVQIEIPIKQDVTLPLDQEVSFPIKTNLEIPVNKTIYIKKTLPISTSVMIDTSVKVPMNISGMITYIDVPIKKEVPISTSFEINEPVNIYEKIIFPIDQEFKITLKKDVLIPIDTTIKTKIPLPWTSQ